VARESYGINVHENVYRQQDAAIELTKVSRLLMAVDSGKASDFAGKSLANIQLTGFSFLNILDCNYWCPL